LGTSFNASNGTSEHVAARIVPFGKAENSGQQGSRRDCMDGNPPESKGSCGLRKAVIKMSAVFFSGKKIENFLFLHKI
jgi:hypothetical protein